MSSIEIEEMPPMMEKVEETTDAKKKRSFFKFFRRSSEEEKLAKQEKKALKKLEKKQKSSCSPEELEELAKRCEDYQVEREKRLENMRCYLQNVIMPRVDTWHLIEESRWDAEVKEAYQEKIRIEEKIEEIRLEKEIEEEERHRGDPEKNCFFHRGKK